MLAVINTINIGPIILTTVSPINVRLNCQNLCIDCRAERYIRVLKPKKVIMPKDIELKRDNLNINPIKVIRKDITR